jgi:hypothetical protein
MQLLIKLYNDKTPRLGIVYPTEYQASKSFMTLLDQHPSEHFKARIELVNNLANLTLSSVNGSATIVYKQLEFKYDQLNRLQAFIKPQGIFEFYHLYWKENSLFIAKVRFKNPAPIIVSSYEIVTAEGFNG